MKVRKPIFIVGTGRCGSTLLHNILTHHSEVSWLTGLLNRFPSKLSWNRLIMQSIDVPVLSSLIRKKIQPAECYPFWDQYYAGFSAPYRDLVADDVTLKARKDIISALSNLATKKRNRLLIKITGWPRIGFLKKIFLDAQFIHIKRNGKAVANSMLNVPWWHGWGGPQKWRWGALPSQYRKEWEDNEQSFAALAAIEWKILMRAFDDARKEIDSNKYMETTYSKLCANPQRELNRITSFTGLTWSKSFINSINSFSFKNTNDKYKSQLTEKQVKILDNVLGEALKEYNVQ